MSKKVEITGHPRGEAGINESVRRICDRVQKDRLDPSVRAWAIGVLRNAGNPQTESGRAQALLSGVRMRAIYVPDPLDAEAVSSAATTLCLKGDGDGEEGEGSYCLRGGDCDDLLVALLSCILGTGSFGAIVIQYFSETVHVLAGVHTEKGWQRADPSYFDKLGEHYGPRREKWIDVMTGRELCSGSPRCTPSKPSFQNLTQARASGDFVGVGAVDPLTEAVAAGAGPLNTADVNLQAAIARTKAAHDQMTAVRQNLGLPQFDDAWTQQNESGYTSMLSAAQTMRGWNQDVQSGKRQIAWQNSDLAVQGFATDPYFLALDANGNLVVTDTTGKQLGQLGQVVTVPAAIAVAAGSLGLVAVTIGVYLTVEKVAEAYEVHEKSATQQALASAYNTAVQAGVTPDKAQQLVTSLAKITPVTSTEVEQSQGTWLSNLKGIVKYAAYAVAAALTVGVGAYAYEEYKHASEA